MIYGIYTHKHVGDSVILAGAVHNVKTARPDFEFNYDGWAKDIWLHNPDVTDKTPDTILPMVHYGPWREERFAANGNLVEGFTRMLCDHLGIPLVPMATRTPYAVLTDEEIEASREWNGVWLLNANSQKSTVSKAYPYWQDVVDGLKGKIQLVQVGSDEARNVSTDLDGVIDYRGKSQDLRHYMSMIYGCDGILSPPSGIINIGAAFGKRAVVVTGARELARLSDYPNMDFLTTTCCGYGIHEACIALKWGGVRRCSKPVERKGRLFSACMEMIEPQRIINAVTNFI